MIALILSLLALILAVLALSEFAQDRRLLPAAVFCLALAHLVGHFGG